MRYIFFGLTLLLFSSNLAEASEFDFFVSFQKCKITTAYLIPYDKSLKVIDGISSDMGCSRKATKMSCTYKLNGEEVKTTEYNVILDSPPLLYLSTSNGSEMIAIDTSRHTAAMLTRIAGKKYLASKVCQGLYATAYELNNLGKK